MAEDLLNLTGLTYFKQKCDATYITEDDVPVKSVKVNGTALTPDAQGAVDVQALKMDVYGGGGDLAGIDQVSISPGKYSGSNAVLDLNPTANGFLYKLYVDGKGNAFQKAIPDEARVAAMIAAAQVGVTWDIVTDLPATGTAGKMYLKGPIGTGTNIYEEWIWINTGTEQAPNWVWENIGTTAIDLSGYVQKTDIELITTQQIDALFAA